jgi:hypothetical protein
VRSKAKFLATKINGAKGGRPKKLADPADNADGYRATPTKSSATPQLKPGSTAPPSSVSPSRTQRGGASRDDSVRVRAVREGR